MSEEQKDEFGGNMATYSPEDNKLRLYVGRVPREEFLKLRAEGWVTLHKQREAGGGDFAAVWTPQRRDTALAYAGVILDEDMGPAERAADRAERFSGYRDRRTSDATGHADRYDAGPTVHGYQNRDRAERAAARHDRIADRSLDAWSKAEYWQRRTAGVINHALHKSSPGVRMGRIKTLEAELRKMQSGLEDYAAMYRDFQKLAAIADPEKQTAAVKHYCDTRNIWAEYMHPRIETVTNQRIKEHKTSLYTLLSMVRHGYGTNDISGAEACALFFSDHSEPKTENSWTVHLKLRLAYENQMLEAQGGRLAAVEIVPGGRLGGKLIVKVHKSPATGRVTSVFIKGPKVTGYQYRTRNVPGADYSLHQFETERMAPGAYTPPTEADLKELAELKAKTKAAAPKKEPCPLINPTDADAERLQALWNERKLARLDDYDKKRFVPATVCRIPQAVYSAQSKGSYAKAKTRELGHDGKLQAEHYNAETIKVLCQIRVTGYDPHRVIVITDKPQKPFPAAVWEKYTPPPPKVAPAGPSESITCSACESQTPRETWEKGSNALFTAAIICPVCDMHHAATDADRTADTAVTDSVKKGSVVEHKHKPGAAKFWNCDCTHQEQTSAVYDEKVCPKCGEKMHNDTEEIERQLKQGERSEQSVLVFGKD